MARYKQGFARPGAATATINYYRSFFDYETRYFGIQWHACMHAPKVILSHCQGLSMGPHACLSRSYEAFFMCRWPSPEYRKGKDVLNGKLPMPVLMLYAANDSALGPQLVRVGLTPILHRSDGQG